MKVHIVKAVSMEELQLEFMETVKESIKELEKNRQKKTDFTKLEEKMQKLKERLSKTVQDKLKKIEQLEKELGNAKAKRSRI